MKKLLFGILTFLGIGLSFCSAGELTMYCSNSDYDNCYNYIDIDFPAGDYVFDYSFLSGPSCNDFSTYITDPYLISTDSNKIFISLSSSTTINVEIGCIGASAFDGNFSLLYDFFPFSTGSSISDIGVYYNNGNSVETITCDGTQAIEIKGLSSLTSSNTFTPYYNISYTDEDNQKLIESYSKDILYLENGQFKKTYTGNNDWVLSVQGNSDNSFSGYLPTFEITGSVDPNDEFTGNVFNNFADNSLKFLFSNIPSYIQYFIILLILFLILGFVKKFKRK